MSTSKIKRDRLTNITYAQIAAMSWFVFGMGPALGLLREDFGVTRTAIAFHNVSSSIGSILAGVTSTVLIAKFGRGNTIRVGAIGMVVGLLLFTTGSTIWLTIPGMFVCGYSGILIIQCNSAFLNNHHGQNAPAVISEVNSLGALIGFLAPIVLGLGIATGFGWRIGLGSVVIAFIAIEFIRGKNISAFGGKKSAESHSDHDRAGKMPKLFWPAWLALACTTAIEASTLTWGSELLVTRSGLELATATAAVGNLVLGMGVGRFFGSRLMQRRDVEALYRYSLAGAFLSFLVFWQSTNQVIQLFALGLMGLIMSVHFPLGITRLMRSSQGRPDRAAAMSSIGSGSAAGFIPFLVGLFADKTNIILAFTIPAGALLIALVLAIRFPIAQVSRVESEIGL